MTRKAPWIVLFTLMFITFLILVNTIPWQYDRYADFDSAGVVPVQTV